MPLYPVDDARALANETFPLAAGPLRILLGERGDRRHTAMIWLAAQPAEKGALEQFGVQAVGLCPPVLSPIPTLSKLTSTQAGMPRRWAASTVMLSSAIASNIHRLVLWISSWR